MGYLPPTANAPHPLTPTRIRRAKSVGNRFIIVPEGTDMAMRGGVGSDPPAGALCAPAFPRAMGGSEATHKQKPYGRNWGPSSQRVLLGPLALTSSEILKHPLGVQEAHVCSSQLERPSGPALWASCRSLSTCSSFASGVLWAGVHTGP